MRRLVVPLLGLSLGCGEPGAGEHPEVLHVPPGSVSVQQDVSQDASDEDDVAVGPCKHELKRQCKVTLKVRNGIRTCAVGEQRCEGGRWSECRSKPEQHDGSAGAAGAASQ